MKADYPIKGLLDLQETTIRTVARGKKTVVTFWTTGCARCSRSLDTIDRYSTFDRCFDIEFISVCCGDEISGRNTVLHNLSAARAQNPRTLHYFVTQEEKEHLKVAYNFTHVPYYVMLDEHGGILCSGHDLYDDVLYDVMD